MKKNLLFIALLLVGLVSCDNNTDEQGPLPTISNYTVEAGHEDGHRVAEEGEIVVIMGKEAMIEANLVGSSLSTVQLDIHWAGGHEHARLNSDGEVPQWTDKIVWKFGEEGGLTPAGVYPNSHELHQHIDVPTGVAEGDYHFVLHLWDQNGNETQQALTVEVHEEGHDHE